MVPETLFFGIKWNNAELFDEALWLIPVYVGGRLIQVLGQHENTDWFLFVCMCMYLCECLCMQRGQRRVWYLWSWSYGRLWAAWPGLWKLNSSPLHDQQVPFITESSLVLMLSLKCFQNCGERPAHATVPVSAAPVIPKLLSAWPYLWLLLKSKKPCSSSLLQCHEESCGTPTKNLHPISPEDGILGMPEALVDSGCWLCCWMRMNNTSSYK